MKLEKLFYIQDPLKQNPEVLIDTFIPGDLRLHFNRPITNQSFLTKSIIFIHFHCDHPTLTEFIQILLFIHKENLTI